MNAEKVLVDQTTASEFRANVRAIARLDKNRYSYLNPPMEAGNTQLGARACAMSTGMYGVEIQRSIDEPPVITAWVNNTFVKDTAIKGVTIISCEDLSDEILVKETEDETGRAGNEIVKYIATWADVLRTGTPTLDETDTI